MSASQVEMNRDVSFFSRDVKLLGGDVDAMSRDVDAMSRDVTGPGGATEISRDISVPEIAGDLE